MQYELKCSKCQDLIALTKNQFFVHKEEGVLCPECFRKLSWDKQTEKEKIREFCKHIKDGWMLVRYRPIEVVNKPGWMLPIQRG